MTPIIRRAQAADALAIADVVAAAYTPYLDRMTTRPAPMGDDYATVVASADAWVVDEDGVVLAVLVARVRDDHVLLDNLAVHPAAQGRGMGARLLHVVDEFACAAGTHQVRLYTNVAMTENIAFYARHGFRQTHRAVQDGYDRVFFTRDLP